MMFRAVVFAVALLTAIASVDAQDSTDDPAADASAGSASFGLWGTVTDQSGRPLPGCTVALVPVGDTAAAPSLPLHPHQPSLTTPTQADGGFRLVVPPEDPRFWTAGNISVVVRATGYQSRLVQWPTQRLRSDAPVEIRLDADERIEVCVMRGDQPLAATRVIAAAADGQRFPWCLAREWASSVTDADGKTELRGATAQSLDAIFIISPVVGHQRIDVSRDEDGILVGTVNEPCRVQGTITTPDGSPVPGIGYVKLLFQTLPGGKSSYRHEGLSTSWAFVAPDERGRFNIPAIGAGQLRYSLSCPEDFAYRSSEQFDPIPVAAGSDVQTLHLEMRRQDQLVATILDAESDRPLRNIQIRTFDGRLEPTITDASGQARFYRLRDGVSYYPSDAMDEYYDTAAFYRDSRKLPVDGMIVLEPVRLQRSSAWRGRVVDQEGRPVGGAKVRYEFSKERFTQQLTTFSSGDGSFRLFHLPENTAVKLTAVSADASSDSASIVFPPDLPLDLVLQPRRVVKPSGRVLDLGGSPIEGVSVQIKAAKVSIAEGIRGEELRAADLDDRPQRTRTDSQGRFEFPPTIAWQQRLQLQVIDSSCFPFFSPFIDGQAAAEGAAEGDLPLGDLRVMPRPAKRSLKLRVRAANGDSIPRYQWVMAGARFGRLRGWADSESVSVDVPATVAILAVSADGFHPAFAAIETNADSVDVVLHAATEPLGQRPVSIREFESQQFLDAAEQIFASIDRPELKSSTMHRIMTYANAWSSVAPHDFFDEAFRLLKDNPQMSAYAPMLAATAIETHPEMVESPALDAMAGPDRFFPLMAAITNSEDPDLQEEWLGEALLSARASSGTQRMFALSNLAKTMLTLGFVDLARDTVRDVWEGADELQEIVTTESRDEKVGESRTLGPVLGIYDLDLARKLIRLTAREVEIEGLMAEAELLNVIADPSMVESLDSDRSVTLNAAGVNAWLRLRTNRSSRSRGLPSPEKLARLIDQPQSRVQFLLAHASLADSATQRQDLVRLACEALMQTSPGISGDHYLFHYSGKVRDELRRFDTLEPESVDRLIFSVLWNLPEAFETDRLHTILAVTAQIVAYRDVRLARTLLEPAIRDRGWLYMGRNYTFDRNETLRSVAAIDPSWAIEVVQLLGEREMSHDPVDLMELKCGIVRELVLAANRAR